MRSGRGVGRWSVQALLVLLTACQSGVTPTGTASPPPSLEQPASIAAASASPGATAVAALPTAPPLPRDITAAADAAVDAPTPEAAIGATRKILELAGVVVADEASARKGSPSRMYVSTAQLEVMAYEAQRRASLSRVTFREFARTLAGTGALPSVIAQSGAYPATFTVREQPARFAAFVTSWVKLAEKYHGSTDSDEAALTNAPLLLAALAARQEDSLDLREPFLPSEFRLGSLDVTLLVAGLRRTLLAAAKDMPPLSPVTPTTAPTRQPTPSPSNSPAGAMVGGRLARLADDDERSTLDTNTNADVATDCAAVLEHMNGNVPGLGDLLSFSMSERIKGLVAETIASLSKNTDVVEQRIGVIFEVLGIVFRIQALVLLYQNLEVKTEFGVKQLHKATGSKTPVTAKVIAGIPDEKWEEYKKDKRESPIWSAIRGCGSALGLPLPSDLDDIAGAIKNWGVSWDITNGSAHAELPGAQFLGAGRVAGRLERPLQPLGDHKATDSIIVDLTPEKETDHPGAEVWSPVEVCSWVRTAEPPNLKLLLSAGVSGSGAGDMPITGDAKKIANAGEKLFGPAAVASLVSTIVDVLAGWFQAVVRPVSCGRIGVTYHVPQPGQWTGTIEVRSEYEDSLTYSGRDEYNVWQGESRRTQRSGDELNVAGMDPPFAANGEVAPYIPLPAKQLSYGFNEFVSVSTKEGTNRGGCQYSRVESEDFAGTYSYNSDDAQVTINLYEDGKYTISLVTDEDPLNALVINGTQAGVVEARSLNPRLFECVSTNFSRKGTLPVVHAGGAQSVGGQLDPRNPGSRLSGSQTVFNETTGATTTIRWNLRHEGPIRLPTR